ncbi:MAG: DegT/DnrJ/EryC1/StrS family aminotransferase, partial [bacterium]|nr:DegT/DnrJ/EryC1/StrS family aminotransferase [bacterium]
MKIPITKPCFDDRELELMQKPLETGWVVQGPFVGEFEAKIAAFTGAKYAIAVNSCTSGQFLLSESIGLEAGDEVLIPAFTWISTANAAEFYGARAVFCDIELDTFNIDIRKMEEKITPRTRAIFPVHLFGLCVDMPKIMVLAKKHHLHVIEDCACGLGGKVGQSHCGTFGDAGVFSFHPRKSITTGEGGMIVTDDQRIAEEVASLRNHGAVQTDYFRHNQPGGYMLSQYPRLGFNMRMTDIQGALGVAQMEKLPWILRQKQRLALRYSERLEQINWLKAPVVPQGYEHGYQAYCTLFKPEETLNAVKRRDREAIDRLHE